MIHLTEDSESRIRAKSLHPGGLNLTMDASAAAGMSSGDKVLDIGCGNASSLAMLHDSLGIAPYGIDISEKAIASAQIEHPDFDLTTADASHLPFHDNSFDHVMMECIITLLPGPHAAIKEAIRVLKPSGHLIISVLTSTADVNDPDNTDICRNGLAYPSAISAYLTSVGLEQVLAEDRKADLTQYMIDSIMEYGSLEERLRIETAENGGSVFDCDTPYDSKTTSYHLFVFRKSTPIETHGKLAPSGFNGFGTPVDVLVADRLGVDPAQLTQDIVNEYQLEAFRRTMKHAMQHSRFYREHFSGLDPDEIQTMEDIRSIPVTSESDLAGNEWQFQCLPASDIDRTITVPALDPEDTLSSSGSNDAVSSGHTVALPTSGTSGNRKRVVFTLEDQERSIAFINRGFLTQRCSRGERMIVFMSGTTEGSIGDLVMRAMAPLEMDIKVYGAVNDIADAYKALMEFKPGVVEAIPWHAAALARYGTQFGNPEKEFIRSVNLSADVVPDAIVRRLEELWECSVHRHYGTTEMAIFGGVECEYHQGYHTRPCDILYEIPETDSTGYGEMLITTLDRKAMPLIRYRTGDIARFIDTPCPCGCRIRRIERFLGRKSSLIELTGGSFYLSELADALYSIPQVIDFEVTVNIGIDQTSADGTSTGKVSALGIVVRTLPGDLIGAEAVRDILSGLSVLEDALTSGNAALDISIEETLCFPSGYNLKKKVIRN